MTDICGVTVLGDCLRPQLDGSRGGVDNQVNWLFHAVRRQVAAATSRKVTVLTAAGLADVALPAQGTEAAMTGWARCFDRAPAEVEAALLRRLRGQFCIGYELPPFLVGLLDRNGIGYVDLRVHPVRFLDDLLFAARASDPQAQAWLLDHAVAEVDVVATAGLREAMLRLARPCDLPDDTLLVLGQQRWDSSQIVGGRFYDPAAGGDALSRLCDGYAHVRIKAHPYGNDGALVQLVRRLRPDAEVIHDNVYRLLACEHVRAVLSVNSSVADEAPYFDKIVHRLAASPVAIAWRGDTGRQTCHASIDDSFLAADFWRGVLAPSMSVTPMDGARLAPKPNRLRLALSAFWNFQEIDRDMIPPSTTGAPFRQRRGVRRLHLASRAVAASLLSAVTSFF